MYRFITAMFACFVLFGGALMAQNATGTLQGRVTDASGATVPAAKVTVENQTTGIKQHSTSNNDGIFVSTYLQPGLYRLTVEKTGFTKQVTSGIAMNVGQTVSLTIELKIGDVATTVEVQASAAQLSTESSTLSTVVSGTAILDMPLNGRGLYGLANLVPGVTPGGGGSTPWISGGRNATNEITIDGTSIILPENNVSNLQTGYQPIIDSVAEFSVITNSLAAEYGRTGGGVISVATKGGTNNLHMSAYEFLRNSKLNTNTWLNNRNGVKLAALQNNQFGGTIGGPLVIPKLYDGRNRTFLFFSEQTQRSLNASQSQASVPIAAWAAGDFSQLKNGNGQGIVVYDPSTVDSTNNRAPFAGNLIPANRINPIAKNLLKYWPTPNAVPTNQFTFQNNFFASGKSVGDDDRFDSRIDHNFSDKLRAFARGSWVKGYSQPLNGFGNPGTSIGDGPNNSNTYNVTSNFIYTANANTIVNFNYGFVRNVGVRYPFSEGLSPATLGFPSSYANVAGISNFEFPNFSFGGNTNVSNLGQATFTTLLNRPSAHIVRGDLTKIMGRHTLKAGGDWSKLFLNFTQLGSPDGQFSFGAGFTQQVVNASAVATQGNGFATFLIGQPSSGSMSHSFDAATSSSYAGFYVQDDWKVTNKLTLNVGLRYDVDIPRTERYNRLSYFDTDAPSPIAGKVPASACAACGNLKGAMLFVGLPGSKYGRHQTPTDTNNFGPRFGFAYHALPKTVIRGAYAILYSPSVMQAAGTSGSSGTEGFESSSPMNVTIDNGKTFLTNLSNPFPAFNLPPGSTPSPIGGPSTQLGLGISSGLFIDYQNPMIQQWNFNIQQEVKGSWIVQAGYLGSKGQHLIDGESNMPITQLRASALALGAGLTQQVANPFFGVIANPTSTLGTSPTVQARQLLSPYPQYSGISAFRKPQANSNYHSMILSAEKRFSKGFGLLFSFTGSKLIDDASQVVTFLGAAGNKQDFYNRKGEKSVSAQDQSRRMVISSNWELPFGKGRRWMSGAPGAVNAVLGGWQLNGIATFAKGLPIAIGNGGNNTNINSPGQRPNNNGTSGAKTGAIADRVSAANPYFDTTVFSAAPIYTFGNLGRFVADIRGPGTHNLDASIHKNFTFVERYNVQLRGEAFNFTNSPTWGGPNTTVTAVGQFGTITSASGQRQVQVALKLGF